jgi:acetyl-CoA acetyltransferase
MTSNPSDTWIIGTGEARTALARDDVSITEFAWEAVRPALADAGTELRAIEGAVTASQDFWDGRTISSMSVNEIVGGVFGSEAKVAADACLGLGYAHARVADGDQHLNLVVAHAKESQGDPHTIELAAFDPYFERAVDPDETIIVAFQAQLLYAEGHFTPAHAARVVAAARSRSRVLGPVSPDDVLGSTPTADPLRALDRAPLLDAAAAIVICDDDTRLSLGRDGVRIVATASRTGAYWNQRPRLQSAEEARAAADDALALAGWTFGDLDLIELNAPYAHQHLMVGHALGLGDGEELVARFEGATNGLALNPSGGWLAGSAGSVAGLHAVISAVERLQASGGRALVHSTTGLATQSHHVVLLEATS